MSSSFYTNSRQYRDIAEQAADAAAISAAAAEISSASAAASANDAANALQAVVDASDAAAASALAAETAYQDTLVIIAGVDADVLACENAVTSAQTYASNAAGSASTASAQAVLAAASAVAADASADAASASEVAADASADAAALSADEVAAALVWLEGVQRGVNGFLNPAFLFTESGDVNTSPANGNYVASTWNCIRDTTTGVFTLTPVDSGPTTQVPGNILRLNITTALGGGTYVGFGERVEDVRTYAERVVALSIHVRNSGANPVVMLAEATQNFGSGGSPSAAVTTSAVENGTAGMTVAAGESKRLTFHISVPSIVGKTIGTDAPYWANTRTTFKFFTTSLGVCDVAFRAAQLEVVPTVTTPAGAYWMPPAGAQRVAIDRMVRTMTIKQLAAMEASTSSIVSGVPLNGPIPRRAATVTTVDQRWWDGTWRTTGTLVATHVAGDSGLALALSGISGTALGTAALMDFTLLVDARF